MTDAPMITLHHGDCLQVLPALPDASVHCCVTSPPYFGLRDYGIDGQIGLEPTPEQYVAKLVQVFREVRRVLRDDGTVWLNLGDSYNGSGGIGGAGKQHTNGGSVTRPDNRAGWSGLKQKDLIGIPWRVAFALQADGWYLRQDIIWHKPNPMPESVRDRCTKAHEYIFLLTKQPRYYYDAEAIKEPLSEATVNDRRFGLERHENKGVRAEYCAENGEEKISPSFWAADASGRNRRSVWTVTTKPYPEAHFATFPPDLIEPCILAGCPRGGVVLDPFNGSGTTGAVAIQHGRKYVGIELNVKYLDLTRKRLDNVQMGMFDAA